jgi:hypothetical protein
MNTNFFSRTYRWRKQKIPSRDKYNLVEKKTSTRNDTKEECHYSNMECTANKIISENDLYIYHSIFSFKKNKSSNDIKQIKRVTFSRYSSVVLIPTNCENKKGDIGI